MLLIKNLLHPQKKKVITKLQRKSTKISIIFFKHKPPTKTRKLTIYRSPR